MWTSKRVLILVLGVGLFVLSYGVYAHFLGSIDGLAPLPTDYLPSLRDTGDIPPPQLIESDTARKLRMAFGTAGNLDKVNENLQLWIPSKNLALAAKENSVEGGRLKLEKFAAAIFGKPGAEGGFPEINTITSDVAFLKFDQPISNLTEINNRRIVGAQLEGNVHIVNNRRSRQLDDDLSLFTQGPVYYEEQRHLIFTNRTVRLVDTQGKPEPSIVDAEGMDIELTNETGHPADKPGGQKKPKVESVTGVKQIHLRRNVHMVFWAPNSGFLDTAKASQAKVEKKAANQKPEQEKSKVSIRTPGPFVYDPNAKKAVFEIPARAGLEKGGPEQESVWVTRFHDKEKSDNLWCDRLELQFRAKESTEAGKEQEKNADDAGMDIETAHATGKKVRLSSDNEEGLEAEGNDFTYNAPTRQSILKGEPYMTAAKAGHYIEAPELQLRNLGQEQGTQAKATGKGRIDLLNRTTGKRNTHAFWEKELLFVKDGGLDCLTLTGQAIFEDDEHKQKMRGHQLKVWLLQNDKTPGGSPPSPSSGAKDDNHGLRPHHLIAKGNVSVDSPELHVKEPTESLVVWFKDVPEVAADPIVPEGSQNTVQLASPVSDTERPSASPAITLEKPAAAPRPGHQKSQADPSKKPMELRARSIEAFVLRTNSKTEGPKNDLEKLSCEGSVWVHQDPSTPEDKGVNITGETLLLDHFLEGNVLFVTGGNGNFAQVQLDKQTIMGNEVRIDQKNNTADVNGPGSMKMLTSTDFEGGALAQPADLVVHWVDKMNFDGSSRYALFQGNIQAEQKDARLLCQDMQVTLDRPVSFKESGKKDQTPAKVSKIVCDKKVMIEDTKKEGEAVRAYQRLTARDVSVDNEAGTKLASGPGIVHLWQPGSADEGFALSPSDKDGGPGHSAKKPDKPKEEMKLTRISFRDRLFSFNQNQSAIFYGGVVVVRLPAKDPDLKVDIDNLPPEGMYLRSDKLNVHRHPLSLGQTYQEMVAEGKVLLRSQEYYGSADVVKYDQSKEQIVLQGRNGNLARLYRIKIPGAKPDEFKGQTIIYWRRTNDIKVQDGQGINLRQ